MEEIVMAQASYMTEEGLDNLKKELDQLISVERHAISLQIAEARDKGDLSENAEYAAAKDAQSLLELRISKLQETINSARLIDETKLDDSKVLIFSTVKLKNMKSGTVVCYTLVQENESNVREGKISVNSPIAKGILGKSIGEKVDITVPAGIISFEIMEISRNNT